MQVKKTSKIFFGKYPYKICCLVPNAREINFTVNPASGYYNRYYLQDLQEKLSHPETQEFILQMKEYISREIEADFKTRIEGKHFNFFVKDESVLDDIVKKAKDFVIEVWKPENQQQLEYMVENGPRKIVVDALPFKKFRYKIYFKYSMKVDRRAMFCDWLRKYNKDCYRVTGDSLSFLSNTRNYCFDPFLYVTESKMASMVALYLGGDLKRIEEFIPKEELMQV